MSTHPKFNEARRQELTRRMLRSLTTPASPFHPEHVPTPPGRSRTATAMTLLAIERATGSLTAAGLPASADQTTDPILPSPASRDAHAITAAVARRRANSRPGRGLYDVSVTTVTRRRTSFSRSRSRTAAATPPVLLPGTPAPAPTGKPPATPPANIPTALFNAIHALGIALDQNGDVTTAAQAVVTEFLKVE